LSKYFFHLRTNDVIELDTEGAEFGSDDLAVEEAVRAAREMMMDAVITDDTPLIQQFEIMRDDGSSTRIVRFEATTRVDGSAISGNPR